MVTEFFHTECRRNISNTNDFDHIPKHREDSWKYVAQRSIFDELLSFVFDITSLSCLHPCCHPIQVMWWLIGRLQLFCLEKLPFNQLRRQLWHERPLQGCANDSKLDWKTPENCHLTSTDTLHNCKHHVVWIGWQYSDQIFKHRYSHYFLCWNLMNY